MVTSWEEVKKVVASAHAYILQHDGPFPSKLRQEGKPRALGECHMALGRYGPRISIPREWRHSFPRFRSNVEDETTTQSDQAQQANLFMRVSP